jgi:hypothetical protein
VATQFEIKRLEAVGMKTAEDHFIPGEGRQSRIATTCRNAGVRRWPTIDHQVIEQMEMGIHPSLLDIVSPGIFIV